MGHKQTDAEKLRDRMLDDPKFLAEVREGVRAMKEGRTTSWEDVKRELGIPDAEIGD